MRQAEKPELQKRLFSALSKLSDIYPDFDIITWASAEDEDEVLAIIHLIEEYPEITTSDIIDFQLWLEDQREDGKL